MFLLTEAPIDTQEIVNSLAQASVGGLVSFEGRVRDHNAGRAVEALEYEVYPELALSEGNVIIDEAKGKFPIVSATAIHRYGLLNLQDIAISIVVVASHRDAAFEACRYIIDEVKQRVPIWKREHYRAGSKEWVDCPGCRAHRHERQQTVVTS
jgi:molybdopterin synthase catalytic subunit